MQSSYSGSHSHSTDGFTMIELLVVVIIAGVLAAISAPGWLGFMENQRLKAANEISLAAIRLAQSKSIQERRSYQASFRTTTANIVQFAIHPTDTTSSTTAISTAVNTLSWENYSTSIRIHSSDNTTTSLNTGSSGGITYYWIAFDYNGNYVDTGTGGDLTDTASPRLTFSSSTSNSNSRRCVTLNTILGNLSLGSDTQPTVNTNQDCQDL